MRQTHRDRSRRSRRKQLFTNRLMVFVIAVIVIGVVGMFGVFTWFARDLPAPGKLSQTAQSATVFYDRDNKVLFELYKDRNRVPVESDEVSKYAKNATVAIEDKNFYHHRGFSETGILRALYSIATKQGMQGGSTITQQLIKNVLLDARQTPSRKIKEIMLSTEVERRYTKDQILVMYMNEVPYGGSFWGVGSAARGYFDKSPKDLTILESAFLAGLPQQPSRFSPFIGEKNAWKNRTKDVLRRMREDKYITKDEEKKALVDLEKLRFTTPKLAITAPHFVFYVKDLIEKEYGVKLLDQGIRVKTTLKRDIQKMAEKVVQEEIIKLKDSNVGNGASVVLDSKSGEVLAMVGSYDYNNENYGKFNAAAEALRQPGSTIKPITYATAFEKGYTPATVIMDLKTSFPDGDDKQYEPVNYDGKFRGPTQIRFALGNSYNIPAVKVLAMVGVRDFLKKAEAMGLKQFAPTQANINRFGLAITLGGGETTLLDMTGSFSVFAREGKQRDLSSILEIKDYKGKTLFKKKDTPESQVVTPEASFLISHILSDNNARVDAFGTSSYLTIPGKTVAVKTGTTNDKRDNWTIGYTNDVTVGVWVGNNDNSPMDQKIASGVTGASPIWSRIMTNLLKEYKDGIMNKPEKVKAITIDSYLGGLPKDGYPTRSEYFVEGTEPKDVSPFYKKLKISKSTQKLANDVELRTNNYDEKDFIVITESDPVSTDGKNRWQEAIDAWSREQGEKGDEKFKFPTENSDARQDEAAVSIKSPSDRARVDDNNVTVKATITSIAPIKNTKIYFNNEEKKNIDGNRQDIDETFNVPDGVYEIKVVVKNDKDKEGTSTIKIGVKKDWDKP